MKVKLHKNATQMGGNGLLYSQNLDATEVSMSKAT